MTDDEQPPNVWIFHGDGAPFASGVFANRQDAMAWIARHRLTGILTEYPSVTAAMTSRYMTGTSRRAAHTTEHHTTSHSSHPARRPMFTSVTDGRTITTATRTNLRRRSASASPPG